MKQLSLYLVIGTKSSLLDPDGPIETSFKHADHDVIRADTACARAREEKPDYYWQVYCVQLNAQ